MLVLMLVSHLRSMSSYGNFLSGNQWISVFHYHCNRQNLKRCTYHWYTGVLSGRKVGLSNLYCNVPWKEQETCYIKRLDDQPIC